MSSPPPAVVVEDEEDEDMADLFSFGSSEMSVEDGAADAAMAAASGGLDSSSPALTTLEKTTATEGEDPTGAKQRYSAGSADSEDSFSNLLDAAVTTSGSTLLDPARRLQHDQETEDILNWLNHDDDDQDDTMETMVFSAVESPSATTTAANQAKPATDEGTDSQTAAAPSTTTPPTSATTEPIVVEIPPEPTVVALPPEFSSLEEALRSDASTVSQIRRLYHDYPVDSGPLVLESVPQLRAELWCRLLNGGKSVPETQRSSLADALEQWTAPCKTEDEDEDMIWIRQQAQHLAALASSSATSASSSDEEINNDDSTAVVVNPADLERMLLYHHYQQQEQRKLQQSSSSDDQDGGEKSTTEATTAKSNITHHHHHRDALLPPVACTLLSAGLPVTVANLLFTQHLLPDYMPLLALQPRERWEAALTLHASLYLLASYHIPLLVCHLDRQLPGWYWPQIPAAAAAAVEENSSGENNQDGSSVTARVRDIQQQGKMPPSWLLSYMAGEGEGRVVLPLAVVRKLWDGVFTMPEKTTCMRFFLTLAVLEQAATDLLLLTGQDLVQGLEDVLSLKDKEGTTVSGGWVEDWWKRAEELLASTPKSVVDKLNKVEDEAIQHALWRRQERAEAELQARLERQAEAHRIAQEQKAEQARERLTRARLVAFYRKHAPNKEGNIDKIMEMYADRFDVLDAKLKSKYGEGFNPALKPKPASSTASKLLSTMNQGLGSSHSSKSATQGDDVKGPAGDEPLAPASSAKGEIAVTVMADEVLPILCWSKEAAAIRGVQHRRRRLNEANSGRPPLKFYLVDSRSEDAAREQGRFPTAISLSPEAMLDPERIQQNEEMFESFRGAVHIVVMGEGFSALPELYNEKLSPKLETLMQEDVSKTNICALFFIKKGFPFVSILDGGFAQAHAWLVREGPSRHLEASSVLVDYDPEASLFGQMETLHNASATEKAQRKMHGLLESSLVAMTRRAQQLERLASDVESSDGRQGIRLNSLFGRTRSEAKDDSAELTTGAASTDAEKEKSESMFKNPFAAKNKPVVVQVDKAQLDTADSKPDETTQELTAAEVSAETTEADNKEGETTGNKKPDLARASSSNSAEAIPDATTATPTTEVSRPPADASSSDQPQAAATNRFAMLRQAAVMSVQKATSGDSNVTSASPDKTGAPNMLQRNPFARFGGGGNKVANQEVHDSKQASNTFAGLNQFRRNTMARMRRAGSFDDDEIAAEESVSFETTANLHT